MSSCKNGQWGDIREVGRRVRREKDINVLCDSPTITTTTTSTPLTNDMADVLFEFELLGRSTSQSSPTVLL